MTLQMIAIKNLIPSPLNVRTTPASREDDKRLLASIKAEGVNQSLTVVASAKKGKFEVVAGGRRLQACKTLVKDKHWKATDELPCIIKTAEDALAEISLVENTHRAALHPADEFLRYKELNDGGMAIKTIANNLGVSQRHVKQRLELAKVHPSFVDLYRNGTIDIETIKALTLEPDHDRQLKIYGEHKNQWDIRKAIKSAAVTPDNQLAKFVGIDAYKKAGGTTSGDLFSDDKWLDDGELLNNLAIEKLNQAAAELKQQGWKWVDVSIKDPHQAAQRMTAISRVSATAPEKLTNRLKELDDLIEPLEFSDEDLTPEQAKTLEDLQEEFNQVDTAIDDYIKLNSTYDPEEQALAGCLLYVDHGGNMDGYYGYVKKEDKPALKALHQSREEPAEELSEANPQEVQEDTTATDRTSEQSEDQGEPEQDQGNTPAPSTPTATADISSDDISQKLQGDLTATRLQIIQAHLATNAELARDLLYFTLAMRILTDNVWRRSAIDLHLTVTLPEWDQKEHGIDETKAAHKLAELRKVLDLTWFKPNDPATSFKAFCGINSARKQAILAWCVSQLLLSDTSDLLGHITSELNIKWHDYWRPTSDNFLNRISKQQLIDLGNIYLSEHNSWTTITKDKKEHLANTLEEVFAGRDDRLTESQRSHARKWVPEAITGE